MTRRWWRDMVVVIAAAVFAVGTAQADAQLEVPALPVEPPSLPALPAPVTPAVPQLSPLPVVPAPAPLGDAEVPVVPSAPAVADARAPVRPPARALGGAQVPVGPPARTLGRAKLPVAGPQAAPVGGAEVPAGGEAAQPQPRGTHAGPQPPRRPQAKPEPSPRRLRRVLAPLAACVATLGPLQERVIVRRAGLGGFSGRSRAELAADLGLSRARVARLEHRALRSLRRKLHAGGCSEPATPAVETTEVSAPLPAAPAAGAGGGESRGAVKGITASGGRSLVDHVVATATKLVGPQATAAAVTAAARSYADDHPVQFALAVFVTLLCALLLVRELRRDFRGTRFRF